MSTTEGPNHFPLEKIKKLRGRPKKSLPISEPEHLPVVEPLHLQPEPVVNSGVNSGHPPGVGVEEPKKNRRKKYGSAQEVYDGSFPITKSGLKKEDLVLTPKGKLMSKTRYQNLIEAGKRLLKSREA
jgi:hypothetical protein